MKSNLILSKFVVTVSTVLMLSSTAFATNGYFTHGVGARSKGMAGTGVGSSADMGPIMAASNPALAIFSGVEWEVGVGLFSPRRSYSVSASQNGGAFGTFSLGAGSYDSGSEWFPIPYVAKNWRIGDDEALTLLFYGRGGMNTDWDDLSASASFDPTGQGNPPITLPGTFGGGKAGVDLSQAFLSLSYAGKTSDRFAWGAGPIVAMQAFEATGVGNFAGFTRTLAASGGTSFPTALSDNGHEISIGWGFAGGIWFALSDSISAGLSYQSELSMGEFDDYSDLFAEGGDFDIPASIKAGLSFMASDAVRVNLDIEHTQFSEIDSVGNPLANLFGCPTANPQATNIEACLGGSQGAGFGWDDMTTYKVGVEWRANDQHTWRFGYSFGEQPIQEQDVIFNILAPAVMEQHFTFGLTRSRPNGGVWNFSMMFAPENSISGPNVFDQTPFNPVPPQIIELEMNQFEFEVSVTF